MSDFVVNNVVSMEWEKKGFCKIKKCFYFATKEYTNAQGQTVAVFFSPFEAFLWADNNAATYPDLWSLNDFMPWAVENVDGTFPQSWDECIPVLDAHGFNDVLLERFGLTEFKMDIEKRLEDIAKYGELKTKPE